MSIQEKAKASSNKNGWGSLGQGPGGESTETEMLWGKEDGGTGMVNLEKMEELGKEPSALGENWDW